MRGSAANAAASARSASLIFSSGERRWPSGSSRSRAGSVEEYSPGSGSPARGSGAVRRASATASSTRRFTDSRERSEVEAEAEALPRKTRSARRCSRAWATVSTFPMRTWTVEWRSSTRYASASEAPRCLARSRSPVKRSRIPSHLGAAHCDAIHPDWREPDADRNRLAVLAAGADPLVELEVVAHSGHTLQHLGAVADERRPLDGRGQLAVLDQIGLARREDELPVGDVHLPAAEGHGVEPVGDGADDLLRIVLAGQHEGVRHPRHRRIRKGLAPTVSRGRHAHEPRVQPVLQDRKSTRLNSSHHSISY